MHRHPLPAPFVSRFCFSFTLLLTAGTLVASNVWPQFRGPQGDGHAFSENLPLTWSETDNVRWKTAIHGRAWSCPVVWKDQVWVTTATEDGRKLSVLCLDLDTGKILRDIQLFDVDNPQFAHRFNTYASPTPVIEEGRIYVTFGSPGTACLDTATGEVLWQRRDLECNHFRGAGSSPILDGDRLFLNYDGSDFQYMVALDKHTGKTIWKVNRSLDYQDLGPDGKPEAEGDYRKAYGTCHVAELDGRHQLLSQGAKAMYGYDPDTGEELWRVEERENHSGGTRPVVGHGLVFIPTGWGQGQLLAIRPGRNGGVTDANASLAASDTAGSEDAIVAPEVVWKTRRSVPKKPSLLLVDDELFGIDDGGIATCWDAKTGAVLWNERVGGKYSASPVGAPGRIYFFSEEGKATVIAASSEFKKLGESQMEEGFMATPAVAGDSLILRTTGHLYRIDSLQ